MWIKLIVFLGSAVLALAEIVPSVRLVPWSGNVGISNGIPNRSTIYTSLSEGTSRTAIQTALDGCPSNQVVFLEAGGYNIAGTLIIPSGVTMRGAGDDLSTGTILTNAQVQFGSHVEPYSATSTSITGGSTKGSTSITVASAASISIGTMLTIVQSDDSGFVNQVGSQGNCTWCDAGWAGSKNMGQTVEVTDVSGTVLTIDPGLYWGYDQSPTAHRFIAACKMAGVEDLVIWSVSGGTTFNIYAGGASQCWVDTVRSDFAVGDHIRFLWCHRMEVRNSYLFDGWSHGAGGTDDVLFLGHKTSASLIENNIFWRQHASVMLNWGSSGNVISYNYSTNTFHDAYLAWMINDFVFHGAHPSFNLFEGNIGIQHRHDSLWGSSSHSTMLRNWFVGANWYHPPLNARTGSTPTSQQETANNYAYVISYTSRSNNIVGNAAGGTVLAGQSGTVDIRTNGSNSRAEFRFNFNGDTDTYVDPDAFDSAIWHGNWSVFNGAQQWDESIADHAIPDSYYLLSKPSWFGNLDWPPIDPADSNTLDIVAIPAGYRFINGTNPPAEEVGFPVGPPSATVGTLSVKEP